ncbi:hypothetical protein HanIR_Chr06g0299111 [Helianthus annuus]|nr:hypothetical protein HanIR_Chr06g0299111 [Helianthus annuus]
MWTHVSSALFSKHRSSTLASSLLLHPFLLPVDTSTSPPSPLHSPPVTSPTSTVRRCHLHSPTSPSPSQDLRYIMELAQGGAGRCGQWIVNAI